MIFGDYHYRVSQGRIIIPPRVRQFFTAGAEFLFLEKGCVAGVPSAGGLPVDRRRPGYSAVEVTKGGPY